MISVYFALHKSEKYWHAKSQLSRRQALAVGTVPLAVTMTREP
jgi:hypothetical protein